MIAKILSQLKLFSKSILIGAIFALLLTLLQPAIAQKSELAPVVLDGREIFQVGSSQPYTAQTRSDLIESILEVIIESQEVPKIEIEKRNRSPVILINDRHLLTVTQSDTVGDKTPQEQAEIWAKTIRQAVELAQKERSQQYLWQSWGIAGAALLAAIAVHSWLGLLWERSVSGESKDEISQESQSQAIFLKVRLLLARTAVWTIAAAYAIDLFPVTREWSYSIINYSSLSLSFSLGFVLFALVVGQSTPSIAKLMLQQFSPEQGTNIYQNLIEPISNLLRIATTLTIISFSLVWIREYEVVYDFCRFFLDLAVIISIAWLCSRLFRQFVRAYGIELIRKLGREVDELLLVFETLANLIIGFVAVVAFAQSRFDLIGLLAGLGIGGLAIAFAAQKTLEQLLGTVVLYLDRPFVPGEYIRLPDGLFGRVESIGLRSTKIRTAAKSTLAIVPNSTMASLQIENVTRGKKVMVLLYLDFSESLEKRHQALVEQVVKETTNALFGIDPGSTKISLFQPVEKAGTRARITFFILGSSENSLSLRKRLLELANEKISKKLAQEGIAFTMQEPSIYVESPVTI